MITHDTKIRVWYKHTDQMGFVHHSNYICYYEEARSDLMRSHASLPRSSRARFMG